MLATLGHHDHLLTASQLSTLALQNLVSYGESLHLHPVMERLVRDKFCIYGPVTYQFYEPILFAHSSMQVHIWMIRRPPPRTSAPQWGPVRDVETYSFALYDNGEMVDISTHLRLEQFRAFLSTLSNGKKMATPNFEMGFKEAEAFIAGLQLALGENAIIAS